MKVAARVLAVAFGVAALLNGNAEAQDQQGTLTLVVGQAPGGTTDTLARLLAEKLGSRLGRNVIVDIKAGAGGTIAAAAVARAKADGNTLLFTASGHSTNPFLISGLPFDTAKDFTAVGLIAATPYLLVAASGFPAKSVPELVKLVKANPAQGTVAVTAMGSSPHIAAALFRKMSGTALELVAYKGSSQAIPDVISGRVPIAFDNIALMGPYIADGRLKPLAITAKQRSASYPDVPTMIESGYADFDIVGWFGVMAPAATPPAVLDALSKAIVEIKGDRNFIASVTRLGAQMIPGDRRDAETFVQGDLRKMGSMIKELAITANW
jgi:tripartite-type tricarboxylate transporter receptor subunit TctC